MTVIDDLILTVNPGIYLILGGLISIILPSKISQKFNIIIPSLLVFYLWNTEPGHHFGILFLGYNLELFRVDSFSHIFGIIFLIAMALGNLYSIGAIPSKIEKASSMVYAGSATAAVFAGDLITLFIFFEVAAISSVFLIWARGTKRSFTAGFRYLVVQIGAGVILLSGILIHISASGTIAFNQIGIDAPGGLLIFIAFGIKCAFPFFHNWLQDAYPEGTVSGTVILSSFTTKLAIYALARSYAGTDILIWIGALMAAFPIFYAVIENDLRRVLAYSLNNQLGFMVVGIGIGTEMALNGTVSHAFCHILYKSLLFMCMGAVLLRTGTANGSDLGGLFKTMPWTTGFCIVGAASISGFPLFSGFISKSMILTSVSDAGHWEVWLVLLFASAGVFHHSGIKIPYFAFFAHDQGLRPKEAPIPMLFAMGITASLCFLIGIYPDFLYSMLPYPVDYVPYTTSHVINQLQLLMFSALAFAVLMVFKIYPPELRSTNIDFDWVYRRGLYNLMRYLGRIINNSHKKLIFGLLATLNLIIRLLSKSFKPNGVNTKASAYGNGIVWMSAMLLITLLVAYSSG
jgi:multicomponent Na+:H+ antiporter subunit D